MWIKIKGSLVKLGAINFINQNSWKDVQGVEHHYISYHVSECYVAYREEFSSAQEMSQRMAQLESLLMGESQ